MFNYILILIIILAISILIFLNWAQRDIYDKFCTIFKYKDSFHPYADMIRELQRYTICGIAPSYHIRKLIYYKNTIVGCITSNNILILNGTDNIMDTMYDVKINKDYYLKGYVHSGSYEIFLQILDQIKNENINIIIGWSLGAMIGVYTAIWIYKNKGIKCKIILFGLPPIGDNDFKNYYNRHLKENTIVYNHYKDILAYPFLGYNSLYTILTNITDYHHIGKLHKLYNVSNQHVSYFNPYKYNLNFFSK